MGNNTFFDLHNLDSSEVNQILTFSGFKLIKSEFVVFLYAVHGVPYSRSLRQFLTKCRPVTYRIDKEQAVLQRLPGQMKLLGANF